MLFPYDGKQIGKFSEDKMQLITGRIIYFGNDGDPGPDVVGGAFKYGWPTTNGRFNLALGDYTLLAATFDNSRVARTGDETAPAWIAVYICIRY
jgi:hypothetical protein